LSRRRPSLIPFKCTWSFTAFFVFESQYLNLWFILLRKNTRYWQKKLLICGVISKYFFIDISGVISKYYWQHAILLSLFFYHNLMHCRFYSNLHIASAFKQPLPLFITHVFLSIYLLQTRYNLISCLCLYVKNI
jgi:hypothetical protein